MTAYWLRALRIPIVVVTFEINMPLKITAVYVFYNNFQNSFWYYD